MPTEVHSDDVIRVWLATVDQPIDVQPGTFVDDGTTWRAVSFDGTTVTGPVNQIVLRGIVSTETPDPEPEPEPESNRPVVLYSDDRLRRVAQALTDPNSVESKQWARAMGTRYLDPNYQPHQIDVVDTQQKGQDFNTDSQACHALALRWVLTGHDESGGAALR